MRICIISVNYNNSKLTIDFCDSVKRVFTNIDYDLFIVDNDSNESQKKLLNEIGNAKIIFNSVNSGYFQALNIVLKKINADSYDRIIIGNNDIVFDESFENSILLSTYDKTVYAISPRIVTLSGVEQNPMLISGISRLKVYFYDLYFKNYLFGSAIFWIWQFIKRFRKQINDVSKSRIIYMGYGAMYILTPAFFEKNKLLDTPPFLMGEEAFFANQISKAGGVLFFDKTLIVHHRDHSTCAKIPSKQMYQITKESYKIYRSYFLSLQRVDI